MIDFGGDVLFFIGEEHISIAVASDIILRQKPIKWRFDRCAQRNFINTNIVDHENGDIVNGWLNVVDIADQIQQFQHVDVLLL